MAKARGLLTELQRLQQILDGQQPESPTLPAIYGPSPGREPAESADTEVEQLEAGIVSAYKSQVAEAHAEIKGLRKQLKKALQEAERVDQAAVTGRQDAEALSRHLHSQLTAQQQENHELAGTVLQLQHDIAELHAQLERSEGQAALTEEATLASKETAQHWKARHGEAAAQLAASQDQHQSLRAENTELRERLKAAEQALGTERHAHQHAEIRQAALEAVASTHGKQQSSSDALVQQLQQQLALERQWRHATQTSVAALRSESLSHERLLLNVSTALRVGPTPGNPCQTNNPPLPRRAVLGLSMGGQGAQGVAVPPAAADWQKQMAATMGAFDKRSKNLQAELSDMRLEIEHLAASPPRPSDAA